MSLTVKTKLAILGVVFGLVVLIGGVYANIFQNYLILKQNDLINDQNVYSTNQTDRLLDASIRNYEAIVISEQDINHTLVNVNKSIAGIIQSDAVEREKDVNLTKQETEELIDTIESSGKIIPIVNQSLNEINQTMSERLVPVIATLALQRQAQIDHFNQTEVILESIITSANETQMQARVIQNETN